MTDKRPITLITGASAGIGVALARTFAAHGHELVLVARRKQPLIALADEIAATGHKRPLVLPLDITAPDAAAQLGQALAAASLEPSFVVNNAGFGLAGRAVSLDRAEQLAMIDLNVRSLTDLSLAFLPSVIRHRGGILNNASVAAFLPGPGMAVYYATKAYVLSFTEALHRELQPTGVRITALCPGPVLTEFHARAGSRLERGAGAFTLSAERVAEIGYRGFMQGRQLVVPGFLNKLVTVFPRVLPRAVVLRLMGIRKQSHNSNVSKK